jgi:hypothetical protein
MLTAGDRGSEIRWMSSNCYRGLGDDPRINRTIFRFDAVTGRFKGTFGRGADISDPRGIPNVTV